MEKKNVIKLFFAWQDEKEQSWLEQMAADGWMLDDVVFIYYTFHKEKPQTVHYRLDYQELKENELQDYLNLFTDAGWDYKGRMNNWFYFCSRGEKTKEIYTDVHSKVQKYKRIIRTLVLACFLLFYPSISFFYFSERTITSPFDIVMDVIQFLVFLLEILLVYNTIRLAIWINKMEKSL